MSVPEQRTELLQNAKTLLDSELKEAVGLAKVVLNKVDPLDVSPLSMDPSTVLAQAREHLDSAARLHATLSEASDDLVEQLLDSAELYSKLGDSEAAAKSLERALILAKDLGNVSLELLSLHALGALELKKGNYADAREHYEDALGLAHTENLPMFELSALDELAKLATLQNDYAGANEYYSLELELAREADEASLLKTLEALGQLHLSFGEPEEALPHLHEVLALAEYSGFSEKLTQAHAHLASCYEALADYKMALEHQRAFHEAEARQGRAIAPKAVDAEAVDPEAVDPKAVDPKAVDPKATALKATALKAIALKAIDQGEVRLEPSEAVASASDNRAAEPEAKEGVNPLERRALAQAEQLATERTAELEAEQLDAVTRLAIAAEYRDDDTGEHTRRVGRSAAALAYVLDWSAELVERIYVAARLHDVGKIGVSDLILHKAGKFTPEEFEAIKVHTTIGAEILAAGKSDLLRMAEEIALSHHERWDGKGYPYGVAGQDIPAVARIVAVADVLDALTHVRPYKPAWSLEEALSEIERGSGTQFDPQVVKACSKVFGFRKLSPTETEETLKETLEKMGALGLGPK